MTTLFEKLITFFDSPCTCDFERGYLSALLEEYKDRGCMSLTDRELSELEEQIKSEIVS